jgi:DNA repair protein RadC
MAAVRDSSEVQLNEPGGAQNAIAGVGDAGDLHLRDHAALGAAAPAAAGWIISTERDWRRYSPARPVLDLVRGWLPFAKIWALGRRHDGAFAGIAAAGSPCSQWRDPALELADVSHDGPGRTDTAGSARDKASLTRLISPLCGSRANSLAATLLQAYGSLPALLRSNGAALTRQLPGESDVVNLLLAIRPLVRELLRVEMLDGPALPDNQAALDYLFVSLAHEPAEQVRILYLDAKNRILAQEVASQGSVTKTDIFPREILRRALELGATGLIMAHNHPSGDPEPSRSDLQATRAVADAARLFDIHLHDHIIIARSGCLSLRGAGYL